jgi:hypothetical protein
MPKVTPTHLNIQVPTELPTETPLPPPETLDDTILNSFPKNCKVDSTTILDESNYAMGQVYLESWSCFNSGEVNVYTYHYMLEDGNHTKAFMYVFLRKDGALIYRDNRLDGWNHNEKLLNGYKKDMAMR